MAKVNILGESISKADASQVVKVFENPEFGKVRTVVINNEPWFVGNDVAKVLEYANPKDAVKRIVDDEDRFLYSVDNQEGIETSPIENQYVKQITLINESGLYTLILRSNMDKARNFKRWITSEVLPSIRKTGFYSVEQKKEVLSESESYMKGFDIYLEITKKYIRPSDSSIARMINEAGETFNYPKIDYVLSKGVVKSATELLKANGVPLSAIAFNKIAVDKGALVELSRKSSHGYKRFKNIAADWLEFGENQVNPNNPKETQPLWYIDRFPELLKKLEIL